MRPTPKKTRLKENVLTDEDSIDSSGEEEEEPRIAHTVIKEHRKIASLPIRKAPPIVKPAAFAASSSPSAPSSSNGLDGELRTPRQGERRSLASVTALTGKRLVLSSGVHEELPNLDRQVQDPRRTATRQRRQGTSPTPAFEGAVKTERTSSRLVFVFRALLTLQF